MTAEFIQDCSINTPLLNYYAERDWEWQSAGKDIKKAIAELNFVTWFPFSLKNLNNKTYFTVQRMRYENKLYAIVTNSAINYLFRIYG
jgi:hypothetical protein